ncbi:hypothetical protein IF1G_02649 [Cordyceps javanica]|uniref:Uncharacterized protein n=1 Tax=Cordyceps javanica TaxID=43265 RepID=A0A545VAE0_9HYPO|nr:hypothetical protein IF1G_02649 [Cordyceps javanica]
MLALLICCPSSSQSPLPGVAQRGQPSLPTTPASPLFLLPIFFLPSLGHALPSSALLPFSLSIRASSHPSAPQLNKVQDSRVSSVG